MFLGDNFNEYCNPRIESVDHFPSNSEYITLPYNQGGHPNSGNTFANLELINLLEIDQEADDHELSILMERKPCFNNVNF